MRALGERQGRGHENRPGDIDDATVHLRGVRAQGRRGVAVRSEVEPVLNCNSVDIGVLPADCSREPFEGVAERLHLERICDRGVAARCCHEERGFSGVKHAETLCVSDEKRERTL